jgi:cytoskeletal protein CcmA (bactofilin family)
MWKRERPEPIDLQQVVSEPSAPPAPAARPVAQPPAPAVDVTPNRASATPSSQSSAASGSTLGATLRFKGNLVADEDLVIQGQVEGSILHTRNLTIGAQGRVTGDTRARRIIVEGTIAGNLYALESVTVRSGATVRGDVFAPQVAIDEGARLSGRIDMDNAPAIPMVNIAVPGATETELRELADDETDAVLTGS